MSISGCFEPGSCPGNSLVAELLQKLVIAAVTEALTHSNLAECSARLLRRPTESRSSITLFARLPLYISPDKVKLSGDSFGRTWKKYLEAREGLRVF